MPTFDFTSPDGQSYQVDGPNGATPAQAFQILQQHIGSTKKSEPAAQPGSSWIDATVNAGAKALAPIANVPSAYANETRGGVQQMSQGGQQFGSGVKEIGRGEIGSGLKDIGVGAGRAALGAVGYLGAPVSAPIDAMIGQPVGNVAEAATGSPTAGEIARTVADTGATLFLPTPKVSTTVSAPNEIGAAAERLGVSVPRAAATESIPAKASAGALAQVPFVGTPLVSASKKALEGLDKAARGVASSYGEPERFSAGTSAKGGIVNWISDKSDKIADRLYGNVDALVPKAATSKLTKTRNVVDNIAQERKSAFLPKGGAISQIEDAVGHNATLTYDGIKKLRSSIGEQMNQGLLPEGMSKSDLKRIYGALTEDLKAHIAGSGGAKATAAFDKANRLYEQISSKRAALAKLVGADGNAAPEAVLDRIASMASAARGSDLSKLAQARKAMGADAWDDVAAATVNKLGRASPEADFSGDRFITSWNNLSPQGKQLLFGSTNKSDLFRSLEDIATVSKASKSLSQFGNPSGTGRAVTFTGLAASAVTTPLTVLQSMVSGNVLARALAKPASAKSISKWSFAFHAANTEPSASNVARLTIATRNLANNLEGFGGMQMASPAMAAPTER